MSGPLVVDKSNACEVAKAVKAAVSEPARSLAEAVCRVMSRVGYVQKDKQMQGGGSYRYVSVEAVIDALRPEMIREQLVLLPSGVDAMTLENFENRNGTRQNRTQVRYTFKLVHAPSGQSEPVVVIGEAVDVGDKSSNKAMTAARKYALIMAFNIETGLDPDDTPSHEQERRAAVQQLPADNLQLRAAHAQKYGQCKTRQDYLSVNATVAADARGGRLGKGDREALARIDAETAAKFPPAKA